MRAGKPEHADAAFALIEKCVPLRKCENYRLRTTTACGRGPHPSLPPAKPPSPKGKVFIAVLSSFEDFLYIGKVHIGPSPLGKVAAHRADG